jgi:two-component system LytT family sensor kinase
LIVSLYNLYWFFPFREKDIFSVKDMARLLSVTFLVTVIFVVMLAHENYLFFLIFWALQLGLVTPVSWLIYQQRRDKLLELRGVENKLLQTNTDLQSLKAQINPHFLFNTLNSLYSTALREDSEATAEGIQKLGDMMRFMLHDNTRDFIPVSRELEYLSNYISLQKLRIPASSNIAIRESIEVEHCHHEIAPMLLIPLVENAFKYGISLTEKSWIEITLDCNNKGISLEVRNSIYPPAKGDAENGRSGIGLYNIKERLMLFYPGRHKFEYGKENNEFVARLSVQV